MKHTLEFFTHENKMMITLPSIKTTSVSLIIAKVVPTTKMENRNVQIGSTITHLG